MSSETELRPDPLSQSKSISFKNSPFVYGLGTLGLSAIGHACGGYYLFYYGDVLGLTITLAAVVNVIPIADQAALHDVLARIRDINVPLISVTPIEPNSKDEAPPLCSEQAKSVGGAYAD